MHTRFKQSIIAMMVLTMMLFLFGCEAKQNSGEPIIEEPIKYTLTFDTDGGSVLNSMLLEAGDSITYPKNPTKAGYVFNGWNMTIPSVMPAENITVKAIWVAEKYTLSFDTDGGSLMDPMVIDYLSPIGEITEPTKLGHTFKGWDKDIPEIMPNEGLSLKALWDINEYTITFDTDGGSLIEAIIAPYQSTVEVPVQPTKFGYTFVGWSQPIPELIPAENITIKALWTPIPVAKDTLFKEDFEALQNEKDSGNNFSEYIDFDYMGNTPFLWEIINGRIDIGMKAGGNAITLGGFGNEITQAGMGRIYGSLSEGIQMLSFDARLPFSPKSTYPQGNGSDKAINVRIKVYINDILIETLQFKDDDEANKGKTFTLENLNIKGDYTLSIEISSGHRLTIDNLSWMTNVAPKAEVESVLISFEDDRFDFDNNETEHTLNGILFALKEVHTLVMHGEKELAYMDSSKQGSVVARFRGDKDDYFSTPVAYMYNVNPLEYISKLTFDARLFGSQTYFSYDALIEIFIYDKSSSSFVLLETISELGTTFESYEISINESNVILKIQVTQGKVNLVNILYHA